MAKDIKKTIRIPEDIERLMKKGAEALNVAENDVYKFALYYYLKTVAIGVIPH